MTCIQCGHGILPGESYGGSSAEDYICSNCISTVQVTREQKAIKRSIKRGKVKINCAQCGQRMFPGKTRWKSRAGDICSNCFFHNSDRLKIRGKHENKS